MGVSLVFWICFDVIHAFVAVSFGLTQRCASKRSSILTKIGNALHMFDIAEKAKQ